MSHIFVGRDNGIRLVCRADLSHTLFVNRGERPSSGTPPGIPRCLGPVAKLLLLAASGRITTDEIEGA